MDDKTQTEVEAAVFRRFRDHFQTHPDVQNIDLMNLADFCRNCLSKWYRAAAAERGVEMDYDQAREVVYGMPYGRLQVEAPGEGVGRKRWRRSRKARSAGPPRRRRAARLTELPAFDGGPEIEFVGPGGGVLAVQHVIGVGDGVGIEEGIDAAVFDFMRVMRAVDLAVDVDESYVEPAFA